MPDRLDGWGLGRGRVLARLDLPKPGHTPRRIRGKHAQPSHTRHYLRRFHATHVQPSHTRHRLRRFHATHVLTRPTPSIVGTPLVCVLPPRVRPPALCASNGLVCVLPPLACVHCPCARPSPLACVHRPCAHPAGRRASCGWMCAHPTGWCASIALVRVHRPLRASTGLVCIQRADGHRAGGYVRPTGRRAGDGRSPTGRWASCGWVCVLYGLVLRTDAAYLRA
jgi:hypothetical protein